MSDLRLIVRTHYQICEPAYLTILVRQCTSATRSAHRETIAKRFMIETRDMGVSMNISAAGYAVDLGRATGLLSRNNVWTARAHTLNILAGDSGARTDYALRLREKLLLLRIFLECNGASIVYFANRFLEAGSSSTVGTSWVELANDLFVTVMSEYLRLSVDVPTRAKIRQNLKRRVSSPFSGKSGVHQVYFHLQTLFRLGLIDKASGTRENVFFVNQDDAKELPLNRLQKQVPDIQSLEKVAGMGDLFDVVAQVYWKEIDGGRSACGREPVRHEIECVYNSVTSAGVDFCPLATLEDTINVGRILAGDPVLEKQDVINEIRKMQMESPRAVRLHVDRAGRPAFLRM